MSNDLVELSNDIKVITAEINAYQRVAGEAIFEIGKRLKHVKENDLVHGRWASWCSSIGMNRNQATKFITVYEELDVNDSTSNQIGLEALYLISTMPEEQRDKSHTIPSTGETKTVDEMTVRELREVKKALRQANEEDKQILGQLLTEESNKTPEVQYVKDTESEEQLRLYRERYGDISENVYRITNETEISGRVMEFSEHTRDFIKQYAFLRHYEGEFHALNRRSKVEYESTLNALRDFLNDVQRVVEYSKTNEQVISRLSVIQPNYKCYYDLLRTRGDGYLLFPFLYSLRIYRLQGVVKSCG
ncbi:hypothetical protein BK718_01265 [Bacillus thuringiensis serovar andalousiensis]|uniref:DUF3102 domain-containing protein n=1 Tax=Bacillus thuringiensis TaxID=1428 RepID=A0A9X6Q383_BACTU|nr:MULTISPECIES: DUF3102 domain-containing protein [Bacillus cereus group]MDA2611341.1 DUF3102 domain-containing protein [Bacillus cereus]MEB8556372.1 DUF3102 domain-containing protein [Bacillus cereus]MEB8725310.1 DUF3102 domain-containing protein [Bacillus cereus]MEB8820219.1 DUF3102 domain-containing protein [Bacillus cereus]MEB8972292.1 DUF3102 domain-containing protein [Bacillus cereus]